MVSFQHVRSKTFPLAFSLAALTLVSRLVFGLVIPYSTASDEWDHIAANLAMGKGYTSSWPKTYVTYRLIEAEQPNYEFPRVPTATRVPLPVMFFAALYLLFGQTDQALWVGQVAVETLTAILLFLIALQCSRDLRIAALAGLAWAVYVPAMWLARSRYSEPFTTCLMAALAVALIKSVESRSWRWFGLAGLLWGLTMLSRPALASLPVLLCPALWIALRPAFWPAVRGSAIILLVGGMTVLPWFLWTYQTFHAVIPLTSLSGQNLFRENYFLSWDDFLIRRRQDTVALAAKEVLERRFGSVMKVETLPLSQPVVDQVYRMEALEKIQAYPDRYLILSGVRGLRLWFNIGYGTSPSPASWAIFIGHIGLLTLAVYALAAVPDAHRRSLVVLLAVVVHQTLSFMFVTGEFRYIVPLIPYTLVPAAWSAIRLWDGWQKRLKRSPALISRRFA